MLTRRRLALLLGPVAAALALAGCGGGEEPDAAAIEAAAAPAAPRTADYELARMSDLGLREAFVTLTGRSDGKTTAVLDFYVPREGSARDDVYATTIRTGDCSEAGTIEHDLGRLSAGTSVVLVDATIDELAGAIDGGRSTVVIMAPDGKSIAWCGPSV